MSTYVWCEDSGSGLQFWNRIFHVLYEDFFVESKKNNTELCKSAKKINSDDHYYILMDHSVDNPDVLRETQRLHSMIKDKSNITIIKLLSFEFVLLSFKKLEDWVFAQEDSLKEKRMGLLKAKDLFVEIMGNGGDVIKLAALKSSLELQYMNSEQISSKLLFEITRNTGFETTKGTLGECFSVDCCDWKSRMDDDICGLDEDHITADQKMREVFEYSVLKESFAKAGL